MSIQFYRKLLAKIDGYVEDKVQAGEILPSGKTGMKLRAAADFLLYGTSFSEYFAYRFYALNRAEKLTFMTRRHMFRFFDRYNPKELRERIGDKRLTHLYYGDLMKRDQFDYREGLDSFLRFAVMPHPEIVCVKFPCFFMLLRTAVHPNPLRCLQFHRASPCTSFRNDYHNEFLPPTIIP